MSWLGVCVALGACTDLEPGSPLDSGTTMTEDGGTDATVTQEPGGQGGETGGGAGGSGGEAGGGASSGAGASSGGGDSGSGSSGSGGSEPIACPDNLRECDDGRCVGASECCNDDDCPSGGSCDEGVCACPDGTHACGDACASDTSPESCGASCDPCERPSGGGAVCEDERCAPTCPQDERPCAGACLPNTTACTGECPSGSHDCSGVCVLDTSVNGCGDESCTPCPVPMFGSATCDGARCDYECDATYKKCDGECVPESGCCGDEECDDGFSCVSGTCRSFCEIQERPEWVAEDDFQCLDLDTSTSVPSPWVTDIVSGMVMTNSARTYSAPRSLKTLFTSNVNTTARGMIAWESVGAEDIKIFHIQFRVHPEVLPANQPTYEGRMDLMCLDSPGFLQCLSYTNRGTLNGISGDITNYTGYFMHTELSGGAFLTVDCPLTGSLIHGSWNHVEYDANDNGGLWFNGIDAGDCAAAARGSSTKVTLGMAEVGQAAAFWGAYYDNVIVAVGR